ncbi:hypothetical protein PFDG_04969, partial [Plasmodium falciparum Dd2]
MMILIRNDDIHKNDDNHMNLPHGDNYDTHAHADKPFNVRKDQSKNAEAIRNPQQYNIRIIIRRKAASPEFKHALTTSKVQHTVRFLMKFILVCETRHFPLA